MKMKQSVNRIWRTLSVVLPALLLTFELTACDPKGTAARNKLGWLLDENLDMTAEALLDSLDGFNGVVPDFDVQLPVTKKDTRPKVDGYYVNTELNKSLRFNFSDSIDDPYCIGTVSIETQDTTVVKQVHAWGKGIYTVCSIYTRTDVDGNEQQAWGHEPCLMFVYPDGDKILTTKGFKDSERVFHYKGNE